MPHKLCQCAILTVLSLMITAAAQDMKFLLDVVNASQKKLEKIIETESAQRKAGDQAILEKVAKSGPGRSSGPDSLLLSRIAELAQHASRATTAHDSLRTILTDLSARLDSIAGSRPRDQLMEMAEMLKKLLGELKRTIETAESKKSAGNTVAATKETSFPPKDAAVHTIDIGGTLFLHYVYDISETPSIGNDGFSVDRAYVDMKAKANDFLSGRLTLDLDVKDSTYKFVYVKYAYTEFKPGKSGFALRAGQHETHWIGCVDKLWKYRCIEKSLTDYCKILSSADIGVSALYTIPNGYGDAVVQVINGNGYKNVKTNAEKNYQKDIAARISFRPVPRIRNFSGLSFNAGFQYKNEAVLPVEVLTGLAAYEHRRFSAGFEALGATKRDTATKADHFKTVGYSIFGDLPLPFHTKAGLLCRYDSFDPDNTAAHDGTSLLLAGARYLLGPKNVISLVYEKQTKEKTDAKPVILLKANWEAKW